MKEKNKSLNRKKNSCKEKPMFLRDISKKQIKKTTHTHSNRTQKK